VIPTLAPYVLPLLLPELHRNHPDLRLDLLETRTKALVSELAQGELDAGLPTDVEALVTWSGDFREVDRNATEFDSARSTPSTKRLIRSSRKSHENLIAGIKTGDAFLHRLGP